MKSELENWLFNFIHTPAAFEGLRAEDILKADLDESKQIFNRELPKRKAKETFKTFITKDGLELKYWYVTKDANDKVKVLLHGSGSNFCKADRAVTLLDRGFNVAMISYRGHSTNPGTADQKTIIKDVIAAIEDLMALGYSYEKIYLEGSSLGTCVLAHAVARIYQAKGSEKQFASLILKAAPLHIAEKDKYTVESLKANGLDFDKALPFLRKQWNQEEAYTQVLAKEIIVVHGTDDDVVPVEHASKIYKLLTKKNSLVDLRIVQGEGHRLDLGDYNIY